MKNKFFLNRYFLAMLFSCTFFPLWVLISFSLLREHFFTSLLGNLSSQPIYMEKLSGGGDYFQVFYLTWKLKQAFMTGAYSIFEDGFNFIKEGEHFYDIHIGIQYFFGVLSSIFLGDVGGYNFTTAILPLILTFVGGVFWFSVLDIPLSMIFLGAMAITMIPYRISQSYGGHGGGTVMLLLPWYFGFLLRHFLNFETRKFLDLWAGVILFLVTISDEHQGYYLMIFTFIFLAIWIIQQATLKKDWRIIFGQMLHWKYLIGAVLFIIGYGLLINKLLFLSEDGIPKIKRSFQEIHHYSESINYFFHGNTAGNIGAVIGRYILVVSFCLIIVKPKKYLKVFLGNPYLGMMVGFILCLLLMLGMGSHWSQSTGIYEFFYQYVPFFAYQRVPKKIFSLVGCLLVFLFLLLFQYFKNEKFIFPKKIQNVFLYGFVFCLIFQTLQYFNYFRLYARSCYMQEVENLESDFFDFVKNNTDPKDLFLVLPIQDSMNGWATFPQLFAYKTERRFHQGYHGMPPKFIWDKIPILTKLNQGIFTKNVFDVLKDLNTKKIILSLDHISSEDLEKTNQLPFLKKEYCSQHFCLLTVDMASIQENELTQYNLGWSSKTTLHGNQGHWMQKEEAIKGYDRDNKSLFKVISYVENKSAAQKTTAQISVKFIPVLEMDFWVIDETGNSFLIDKKDWQKVESNFYQVSFEIQGTHFYLATKEEFIPILEGVPDYAIYGHFILSISMN